MIGVPLGPAQQLVVVWMVHLERAEPQRSELFDEHVRTCSVIPLDPDRVGDTADTPSIGHKLDGVLRRQRFLVDIRAATLADPLLGEDAPGTKLTVSHRMLPGKARGKGIGKTGGRDDCERAGVSEREHALSKHSRVLDSRDGINAG
jgi:hypothetical protein